MFSHTDNADTALTESLSPEQLYDQAYQSIDAIGTMVYNLRNSGGIHCFSENKAGIINSHLKSINESLTEAKQQGHVGSALILCLWRLLYSKQSIFKCKTDSNSGKNYYFINEDKLDAFIMLSLYLKRVELGVNTLTTFGYRVCNFVMNLDSMKKEQIKEAKKYLKQIETGNFSEEREHPLEDLRYCVLFLAGVFIKELERREEEYTGMLGSLTGHSKTDKIATLMKFLESLNPDVNMPPCQKMMGEFSEADIERLLSGNLEKIIRLFSKIDTCFLPANYSTYDYLSSHLTNFFWTNSKKEEREALTEIKIQEKSCSSRNSNSY